MVYSSNAVEANEGNSFIYNTSVEEESELFEMHDFEEKYRIKSETQLTDDEFNEFKKLRCQYFCIRIVYQQLIIIVLN